jgi:hypothetical protein
MRPNRGSNLFSSSTIRQDMRASNEWLKYFAGERHKPALPCTEKTVQSLFAEPQRQSVYQKNDVQTKTYPRFCDEQKFALSCPPASPHHSLASTMLPIRHRTEKTGPQLRDLATSELHPKPFDNRTQASTQLSGVAEMMLVTVSCVRPQHSGRCLGWALKQLSGTPEDSAMHSVREQICDEELHAGSVTSALHI